MAQNQSDRGHLAPLVAILGPTGSGKSEAALAVARRWPAEIVNCDSLQLYRYLDIGTAKLGPQERCGVPHHFLDLLNPDQLFNAGEYARRARPVVRSIARSGRLPIVAGGTGFYLRALLDGLFPGPPRDDRLRRRLLEAEIRRPGLLHRFLRRFDPPTAARIHPRDRNKLIRAVEACLLGRAPISEQFRRGRDPLEGFETLKIVLDPPREELYRRIERRAEQMFRSGLLDEVRAVLARGFPPESKALEAIGYQQALACLRGEITLEEAIASTQQETRRYAKRQWTWFRREKDAVWVPGFGDERKTQERILSLVSRFLERFPGFAPRGAAR